MIRPDGPDHRPGGGRRPEPCQRRGSVPAVGARRSRSVPPFPKLDDVWGQLQRATKTVEEFDRALGAFPVPDVVGKLFARLDAVHSSGAEGATTTSTNLLEYQNSLRRMLTRLPTSLPSINNP